MSLLLAKQPSKPAQRPRTLRDVSPQFAATSDKLASLAQRENELIGKVGPLAQRLSASRAFEALESSMPKPPTQPPKTITASPAAAALLGELTPPPRTAEIVAFRLRHPELAELHRLGAEMDAVREAQSLLRDPQPGARFGLIERLRLDASEKFCAEIRPEYQAVAGAYVDALLALGKAIVAHETFVKETLRGVAFATLRPVRMPATLGDPTESNSELRILLDWAVEGGHLDKKQILDDWSK